MGYRFPYVGDGIHLFIPQPGTSTTLRDLHGYGLVHHVVYLVTPSFRWYS